MITVPKDFPVQPLKAGDPAGDRVTCGSCGLSWDDSIPTSWTPAPSGRCPFEYFHPEVPRMVTPWNDEAAMPPPTHINGLVVVAAIKVATRGSGELKHQWYVVCEDGNGTYVVWHTGWDRSAYTASHGDYDLHYATAVEVMLRRAGYQGS